MFMQTRSIMIKHFISTAAFAFGALQCLAATSFPEHALRLVVPTTPGAAPDVVARLIGERLSVALGQPVVIDNRPGNGGILGLQAVARAAPDGHTLGLQTLPFVLAPSLMPNVPYDIERDFQPVTLLNWNFAVLVVPASSLITSLDDLVTQAKAMPGALTFASSGNATPSHLTLGLFQKEASVKLTHVPYKGGAGAQTAILAGEVNMFAASTAFAINNINAGKLRALATSAPQRIVSLPDVPTLLELGHPGVALSAWQGTVVPAATPHAIVDRLHAELARILADTEVKARLAALGLEPVGLAPNEFAAHQRADMNNWHSIIRQSGI